MTPSAPSRHPTHWWLALAVLLVLSGCSSMSTLRSFLGAVGVPLSGVDTPPPFKVSDAPIPALKETLTLMQQGAVWEVIVPPGKGVGAQNQQLNQQAIAIQVDGGEHAFEHHVRGGRFFAADATENGKTLNEVLSAYRELFTTAQTLRFTVSPQDYEHREGQLHLRGRFTIAMTFKDEVTTSGQGEITFRLTDTTPPQVQTLRYTFDQ